MSVFPKWRPNKCNSDLEIIEREYAGRAADLKEQHQAQIADLTAKLADKHEELIIQRGLILPKLAAARAELAALQAHNAAWPARKAAMDAELEAAKANAYERSLEMCAAAGIEIPTN